MKSKKTKTLMVALVAALVVVTGAFALFSETLTINGTANTNGTYDIEFQTAVVGSTVACTPTATISGDKNTLTVDVADLDYPGAGTTISVTVANAGTIPAILNAVNLTGTTTDPDVTVDIQAVTGVTLVAGATHTFDIVVEWDAASTTGSKSITFGATLDYEQNTP